MQGANLAAGIAVVACAVFGSGVEPATAQHAPWRHGILEPKSDAGFAMMVTQNGFAETLGLDLKIVPLQNENLALRALLAGELESYDGTPPFQAFARGGNTKVLGCYWVNLPHALFVKDSINSLADLKGKTIAASAPGTLPNLEAQAMLLHAGLQTADVALTAGGGDADRFRALSGGVVDAAVISSEYTPLAAAAKLKPLARAREVLPDFVRYCYITSTAVLKSRPEDVVRFLIAQSQALRYALSHRDETIALAKSASGQKPDDPRAAFVYDDAVSAHAINPELPLPVTTLANMQTTLLKLGAIEKTVDVSAMVDPGPREKALADVTK